MTQIQNATEELPRLLSIAEARAALGGISKSKWHAITAEGKGPKRIKIGRSVHYLASDLREWLEANRA